MDGFTLPEDITSLEESELDDLISQGLEAFEKLFGQERSAENLAQLQSIRDGVNALKSRKQEIETERAEIEAGYDAIAEELAPEEDSEDEDASEDETTMQEDDEDDERDDEDAPTAEDAPADDAPADPPPPVDEDADDPTPVEDDEDEEEMATTTADTTAADADPDPAPEAVAASATDAPKGNTRRAVRLPKRKNTAPPPEENPVRTATILAAANVPDFTSGADMSMEDLARAFSAKFQTFPKGASRGPQIRGGVAKIQKQFPDDLKVSEPASAERVLTHASRESRLEGNSLVAAGGWCAPSETMYDLCTLETVEGIMDLPSVQVDRGGIIHTTGPDFRTIYDASGFCFTEEEDIAGAYSGEVDGGGDPVEGEKPHYNVPCPEFTEDRLEVCGTAVTADVLQDTAYPELTQRIVEGALVAHAHNLNANIIARVASLSDAVTMGASLGATAPILESVEFQVEDMRYRNRMARSRTIEFKAPFWVRPMMRADLAKRLGVDMMSVPDSQLDAWLRDRGVSPQFVYDWQDNFVDTNAAFGNPTHPTEWPDSVKFLLFPSGTFVKGEKDVLQLDAIYDSVNIRSNSFTAIFAEEAWLVAKRCHDARLLTVENLCAEGGTNSGFDPCNVEENGGT